MVLVRLHVYQIQCEACQTRYRAYPDFLVPGTTLTLPAVVFTAYVYETTPLTWRDLVEMWCDEPNRMAHSTLYKAVHALALALITPAGRVWITQLAVLFVSESLFPAITPIRGYIEEELRHKSRFPHTRIREEALHHLFRPLLVRLSQFRDPVRILSAYGRCMQTMQPALSTLLGRLYIRAPCPAATPITK